MQFAHPPYSPENPRLRLVLEQSIQDICAVMSPLFYEPVLDDLHSLDVPGSPRLYVIDQALGEC